MDTIQRLKHPLQILLIITSMMMAQAGLAALQASIDRAVVYDGESFTLTISTDSRQREMPDLALLEKDFRILGTGSSQQVQVINGVSSVKTSWNIQLQAKTPGQYHIPSLRVGKELTNPLQVTVSEPPVVSGAERGEHAFIELEITAPDGPVYLQQQILLTVRLLFDRRLLDGSLSEPAPKDAVVEQLGDDSRYNTRRNGKPFQAIERRYAIFPEKSGQLKVPPVRFSGRFASPEKAKQSPRPVDPMLERFFGGDPFSRSFDRGVAATLQSKSLSLDVLPRPATYTGKHWLPAASLELTDSWVAQPPEFKAGEPVTRTITVKAKGVLAPMLPKPEFSEVEGVSIYPEQPQAETRTDGSWVYAESRHVISYMPTRAGQLTLPALSISWWDTGAAVMRTAEVPEWNLTVQPGQQGQAAQTAQSDASRDADDKLRSEQQPAPGSAEASRQQETDSEGVLDKIQQQWLLLLLVVLAVSIVIILWRRSMRTDSAEAGTTQVSDKLHDRAEHKEDGRELKQMLRKACDENNARAAAATILKMAAAEKPEKPPQTLPALAGMLDSGTEQLHVLDRFLYTAEKTPWDGDAFYKSFKDGLVFKENEKAARHALQPLYPE